MNANTWSGRKGAYEVDATFRGCVVASAENLRRLPEGEPEGTVLVDVDVKEVPTL
jgi:hypothetical protein